MLSGFKTFDGWCFGSVVAEPTLPPAVMLRPFGLKERHAMVYSRTQPRTARGSMVSSMILLATFALRWYWFVEAF